MSGQPDRYVVVEPATKLIVGGPYMWDRRAKWVAPEVARANEPDALAVMPEAEALEAEFAWPTNEPAEGGADESAPE